MAYGFNEDKTKAKVPGFFKDETITPSDVIYLRYGDRSANHTVQNDCWLLVYNILAGQLTEEHKISIQFLRNGDEGLLLYFLDFFGPIPVKQGTVIKLTGNMAVDSEVIVKEYKLDY